MATAGRTLRVALVANTKNFRAGMMSAVRDAKGFQGKMSAVAMNMRGVLGPALAGAAAAAGALAIKMGVDGVKAAMEEQKALAQLTTALDNVGQGFAQTQVDQFIDDLMFATGVADDQLRPAFVRLVSATKDAAEAQGLLSLALDISVGTGRSLEGVTLALSKAATGQTTALRRLGVPLSDAAVKSGDLQAITAELSQTFQGQAAAAAGTMAGRMQILQVAASELQEAFGTGVIGALSDTGDSASDLSARLRELQGDAEDLGKFVGETIGNILDMASVFIDAKNSAEDFLDSLGPVVDIVERAINPFKFLAGNIKLLAGQLSGNDAAVQEAMRDIANVTPEAADAVQTFGYQAGAAADETEDLVEQIGYLEAFVSRTSAILAYEESWDALRKSLRENGKQFDFTTKKGQANNNALIDYAENTAAVAAEQDTLFGKTAYVQDALANLSKTFDKTKMSPETRAAMLEPFQALIDDLADADFDVSTLQQQIDKLQGKNIPITVTTTYIGTPPPGGYPRKEANGGIVRGAGTSTSDSIPARLSNGEFVVRAASVRKFGAGLFQSLNAGVNPLADMSSPNGSRAGGLSIGTINVTSSAGERADTSLPRALRRMAFLAGMNG
jgi:hypothetical protein